MSRMFPLIHAYLETFVLGYRIVRIVYPKTSHLIDLMIGKIIALASFHSSYRVHLPIKKILMNKKQ